MSDPVKLLTFIFKVQVIKGSFYEESGCVSVSRYLIASGIPTSSVNLQLSNVSAFGADLTI